MKELISKVEELKLGAVKDLVDSRSKQFDNFKSRSDEDVFLELCFCLLTANFSAERALKIQNSVGAGFLSLTEEELAFELKRYGHRFPNARAKYIHLAQEHKSSIKSVLESFDDDQSRRDWLVTNIKGLGMKESSHFLRNVGYSNYAILDFHIIDILEEHGVIVRPKSLSKKSYLLIENKLKEFGSLVDLSQGELDFYLWFMQTGKILK